METNLSSSTFSTREALELLTPLLSSPEAQVLRNVATGLGALGTVPAAVHLADLAVLQKDPSVRRHAAFELARLPVELRRAAAERAREHLLAELEPQAVANPERAGHANELLVTLRRQGVAVELPEQPPPRWLEALGRRLGPGRWARLAPVWKPLAFAATHHGLCWQLRRHLVREKPRRPFWWALFCAFLWTLPGVGLTLLLFWLLEPDLDSQVYLGIGLPSALIAAVVAALLHDAAVPIGRYCHRGMGTLIEVEGLVWRPGARGWRQFAFPLAIAVVAVLGLAPMLLGFDDLDLKAFHYLGWFLISTLFLLALFGAMRVGAGLGARWGSRLAAELGAVFGLVVGWVIPAGIFVLWPRPLIALLVSEGGILVPALVSAVFGEHWLADRTPGRGPSRALVWPLIAVLVVCLPGIWLGFQDETPRAERNVAKPPWRWQLAHLPVERSFRVDFAQRARAAVVPTDPKAQIQLRLRHNQRLVEGTAIPGGKAWDLEDTGTYQLEATVGNLRMTSNPLSFVVQESYATAVGLVARRLLVLRDRQPPDSLVGSFVLELVLGEPHQETSSEKR